MTLAGMALGLADLTAVGAFALALPLLSLLFARWSRPVLTLTREPAPAPLTVGQPASVALRVRNAGRRRTEVLALTEQVAPSVAPTPRGGSGFPRRGYGRSCASKAGAIRAPSRGLARWG